MRVIELSTAGARVEHVTAIDDHHVLAIAGGQLRLVDLAANAAFVGEQPAIASSFSRDTGALIALDGDGQLTRWQRTGDRWRSERVPGPRHHGDEVTASPSGRRAVVEDDENAALIDLVSGETIVALPPGSKPTRAGFGVLASGDEVLLISRPGYMDVRVIEAATGQVLRVDDHSETEGFCHVTYGLGAGGTRLATFGCWWAAPYEARLYDVTAWLAPGAAPVEAHLPPPLLVVEPARGNGQLAIDIDTGLTAAIEDRASMTPSQDDDDPLSSLRTREPELAAVFAARRSEAAQLLVVRAIDVARGVVARTTVHPIAGVDERNTHYADGQRVVTFGSRLLVSGADGEQVDHGPLRLPEGACTAITRDASIAVIVAP